MTSQDVYSWCNTFHKTFFPHGKCGVGPLLGLAKFIVKLFNLKNSSNGLFVSICVLVNLKKIRKLILFCAFEILKKPKRVLRKARQNHYWVKRSFQKATWQLKEKDEMDIHEALDKKEARENIEGMHALGTWLFSCTFCCLNREGSGKEME